MFEEHEMEHLERRAGPKTKKSGSLSVDMKTTKERSTGGCYVGGKKKPSGGYYDCPAGANCGTCRRVGSICKKNYDWKDEANCKNLCDCVG